MIPRLKWHRNYDYKGDTYYTDDALNYDIMQHLDIEGVKRWFVYRADGSPALGVEQYLDDAKYVAEMDHASRVKE